jgi:hypothetical protein
MYLDPGDRLSGRQDPPRACRVVTRWGPGGGPRNVLAEYADGARAVIPFPRRLRRPGLRRGDASAPAGDETTDQARRAAEPETDGPPRDTPIRT